MHKCRCNYAPSSHSKPVRPLFIFRTQIKIFLMKSERSLTHRQQHNCNVPRSRNIVRTLVNSPCDISGSTSVFEKLQDYLLCAKKTKITIQQFFFPELPSSANLKSITMHASAFSVISVVYIQGKACACVVILFKCCLMNEGLTCLERLEGE